MVYTKAHMLSAEQNDTKSTMKREGDNNSAGLLPRVMKEMQFRPAFQKGMEERRTMATQRTKVYGLHLHFCVLDKRNCISSVCKVKEEIRKVAIENDFYHHTKTKTPSSLP